MDPSALDGQIGRVRVEEVFGTGQPRLLDASKSLPAAYALRCSELATELASFVGVGDEVLERCNLGVPFGETLAACFDAVGSSSTWLYLLHDQDRLQIRTVTDGAGWEHEELRTFFGHEALLRETVASSAITRLPSPAISSAATDDILRRAGARAALIAPLPYLGSARAALLMFARGPAIDLERWLALALWSANRITQVFTLASALAEREAAQRKAKEEAALLTALVEHAPDNVFHVDPQGIIRFVNRLPAGCPHDHVIDTHWLTHISPDQHPMLKEALQRALTTSETIACEVLGPAADGTAAWYWLRIAAVRRDAETLGAVIIASDLSEKMHTEAQLIVSDRMASVGTLAAGLAHEINNPLASVLANLDMAIRDVAELATRVKVPPELVEELKDARAGGERVRQIARDLKIFSRVENDTRGPVDVERVIDSTLRMAWNEIRHRARLTKDFGNVPAVDGNESRLGQVFLNLVTNAAHAITEGNSDLNEIRIATRLDSLGRVVVTVSDSGPGIPAEIQKRMFTPFFTTKPVGVGTGLGLVICRRIVTSFGGEISFVSEPGKGTEFSVVLPVVRLDTAVASTEEMTVSVASRRGKVLVVDDEEMLIETIKRILSSEHQVTAVDSARRALALLSGGERYDVVICDLMMPQVTGMDFFTELQGLDSAQATRVVFLTGGAFTPNARDFLASVPNQRMEKPFDVQGLRALVNGLIR